MHLVEKGWSIYQTLVSLKCNFFLVLVGYSKILNLSQKRKTQTYHRFPLPALTNKLQAKIHILLILLMVNHLFLFYGQHKEHHHFKAYRIFLQADGCRQAQTWVIKSKIEQNFWLRVFIRMEFTAGHATLSCTRFIVQVLFGIFQFDSKNSRYEKRLQKKSIIFTESFFQQSCFLDF